MSLEDRWRPAQREHSVVWNTHESNKGIINCHGGGAEVNNCRINTFNITLNVSKDVSPETIKALAELFQVANQQLPFVKTQHELEAEGDKRREQKRLSFRSLRRGKTT